MTFFAGFDTSEYPGDEQLTWLSHNTNLTWCAYYLAPAPSHPDQSWMGNRIALVNGGWGLLPIYLGQQTSGPGSHIVTGAQGQIDGADAGTLARNDGFPAGSFVYLDIEDGSAPGPNAIAYFQAWAQALVAAGYSPGFYCSHLIAQTVADAMDQLNPTPNTRIWAFKVSTTATHDYDGDLQEFQTVDPARCGYAAATVWQLEQNAILTFPPQAPVESLTVDLSSSLMDDPSAAGS